MAGIGFKITNMMVRKTFASIYYFDRELPVHFVQFLLGHKNVEDTYHYLRITDDDISDEIRRHLELKKFARKKWRFARNESLHALRIKYFLKFFIKNYNS